MSAIGIRAALREVLIPLRFNQNEKGVPPGIEYVLEAQALKQARDDPRWRRPSLQILLHGGGGSKRQDCAGRLGVGLLWALTAGVYADAVMRGC